MEGTHEKGKVGMDVYGCLWVFFVIIFWNWGILTKKVFLEKGGGGSPGYRTKGTHSFQTVRTHKKNLLNFIKKVIHKI